jgi:hypothetical protein
MVLIPYLAQSLLQVVAVELAQQPSMVWLVALVAVHQTITTCLAVRVAQVTPQALPQVKATMVVTVPHKRLLVVVVQGLLAAMALDLLLVVVALVRPPQ